MHSCPTFYSFSFSFFVNYHYHQTMKMNNYFFSYCYLDLQDNCDSILFRNPSLCLDKNVGMPQQCTRLPLILYFAMFKHIMVALYRQLHFTAVISFEFGQNSYHW